MKLINKLFPGKDFKERVVNEINEVLFKGEFRHEFYVLTFYSVVLFLIVLFFGNNYLFENKEFDWLTIQLLIFVGAYFLFSDMARRKHLFRERLMFYVDATIFTFLILFIISRTGGYNSPMKYTLLFLTSVSSPFFAKFQDVFLYMSFVVIIILEMAITEKGLVPSVSLDLLESMMFFSTALIVNISLGRYRKKVTEINLVNESNDELYAKVQEYNQTLNQKINEKTKEVKEVLASERASKEESELKSKAMLNILEDFSEDQNKLKRLNQDLEENKKQLISIHSLNQEIIKKIDLEEILKTINKHIVKVESNYFAAFAFVGMFDLKNDEISLYVMKNFKTLDFESVEKSKKNIANYFVKFKKLNKQRIVFKENYLTGLPKALNLDKPISHNIIPLKVGENLIGAVYLASKKNEQDFGINSLIESLLASTVSSFVSLNEIYKSQHSQTASLINNLNYGVVMFDKNMKTVLVNPYAKNILDLKNYDNLLKKIDEVFKEVKVHDLIKKSINIGKVQKIDEVEYNKKYVELFSIPVIDANNKNMGAGLIFNDITEAKMINQMKSEFVSVASHQLRTPLTAIKLFTEMLYNEQVGKLNKDQKEYLDNVYQSTDRMVRLVNDLLNVTRIESGRLSIIPEKVNIKQFVGVLVNEAMPLANSKSAKLSMKVEDGIPLINLDKNLVRQVIHNLIVNGIRYSPDEKGKIEVEIKKYKKDYCIIMVTDNGIGIPKDSKKRIFEKFYRSDNAIKVATEGTGLGLYVSKMIIEQSGGKIWFNSSLGKGTTFYATLPIKGMKKKKGDRGLAIS